MRYQDCVGRGPTTLLCSGPHLDGGTGFAAVERLDFDGAAWSAGPVAMRTYPTDALGREGFTSFGEHWFFMPADFPEAKLLVYLRPDAAP